MSYKNNEALVDEIVRLGGKVQVFYDGKWVENDKIDKIFSQILINLVLAHHKPLIRREAFGEAVEAVNNYQAKHTNEPHSHADGTRGATRAIEALEGKE